MNDITTGIVITTIQEPTECVRALANSAQANGIPLFVIGDRKGPQQFPLASANFISIEQQKQLSFRLGRALPEKHYARKNLGYLLAISHGCNCIYETDDDNAPTHFWSVRTLDVSARRVERRTAAPWANVYEIYTPELIWPRGLPLDYARRHFSDDFEVQSQRVKAIAPIQQGLADGAPDVDAVWRLILDREIIFVDFDNILLPKGVWCPFNSQNTWWWKEVFALLYLPSYCSFRMTDIWRSFVAQRCLWELGYEIEFHRADVKQMRNEHNLMHDFSQETVGYLSNDKIRGILESCDLQTGSHNIADNLVSCYMALVQQNVIGEAELFLVDAWLEDLERAGLN